MAVLALTFIEVSHFVLFCDTALTGEALRFTEYKNGGKNGPVLVLKSIPVQLNTRLIILNSPI